VRTEQVNLRLEEDLLAELERVATEESVDRATVIRRLLRDSLGRWRIDQAVRGYQRGLLTMERAAEEADVSVWEMVDVLRRERVPHSMTAEDVRESLAGLEDGAGGPRPGFQTEADWRGSPVVTLADVPPKEGGILLLGINPAPASVASGHYYQGQLGKRMWARLRQLGLLSEPLVPGKEDEAFARGGHGLTDLVKRPSRAASEIDDEEMLAGVELLREHVRSWRPGLILLPFKKTASILFPGSSLQPGPGPKVEAVPTFLLSSPYAPAALGSKVDRMLLDVLFGASSLEKPKPDGRLREREAAPVSKGGTRSAPRQLTARRPGRGKQISMNDPRAVGEFIQMQLKARNRQSVSAVEATRWLREAGVVGKESRPGRALRRLLRDERGTGERISGAHRADGKWSIDRVND
jgi:TDG/mug DNA glycosylase family protein